MRRLLLLIVLLANVLVSFAQHGVKGRVVEADGTPVMYAAVMLDSGKKTEAGVMTEKDGTFLMIGDFKGKYILKVSSIGYQTLKRELECSGKGMKDVGDIILEEDNTMLDEAVVVAGETPKSVSVEKTRIQTASNAAAATGSVLEVIRGVSSVNVDGSGGISIRGNSNVLILVDGIPTTLGDLESIPVANVQSIEIVTSPDVKYDSEGTGGIVNIISKKQSAHLFNAMAAFNYGFNGFLNGNVALNYNKGRWGVHSENPPRAPGRTRRKTEASSGWEIKTSSPLPGRRIRTFSEDSFREGPAGLPYRAGRRAAPSREAWYRRGL